MLKKYDSIVLNLAIERFTLFSKTIKAFVFVAKDMHEDTYEHTHAHIQNSCIHQLFLSCDEAFIANMALRTNNEPKIFFFFKTLNFKILKN